MATPCRSRRNKLAHRHDTDIAIDNDHSFTREQSPPPQYPASEASSSSRPPPFSSLFSPPSVSPSDVTLAAVVNDRAGKFPAAAVDESAEASGSSVAAPAYESRSFDPEQAARAFVTETKRSLPQDTKAGGDPSSRKDDSDAEPPPAYSEGDSPLLTFSYLMAAAGGASSIITQVQQGGPPVNAIGGKTTKLGSGNEKQFANEKKKKMLAPTKPLPWTFGKF